MNPFSPDYDELRASALELARIVAGVGVVSLLVVVAGAFFGAL